MMRHGGMMGPAAMRIIFALMDSDSDGTVSVEEFQAAHERIFKAMDADKDGTRGLPHPKFTLCEIVGMY